MSMADNGVFDNSNFLFLILVLVSQCVRGEEFEGLEYSLPWTTHVINQHYITGKNEIFSVRLV